MYRFQGVPGHSTGHALLSKSARPSMIPDRYVVVILCFLCTLIMYVERVGFSISYTAMARRDGIDETQKGFIMSCFFYGYALTQVRKKLLKT